MKKWIIGILIMALIFLSLTYLLIPSTFRIVNVIFVKSNVNAVQRTLSHQQLWDKWSSGEFTITKVLSNGINVSSSSKGRAVMGQIIVIPLRDDSSGIRWESSLPSATGPLERISGYLNASSLKEKMKQAMDQLKVFCAKDSNVYGINIKQTSTKDTFLLATKFNVDQYPTTNEIYRHIHAIKLFIAEKHLAQTSFPMLNVTSNDSGQYRCMVAVPVNKIAQGKADIFFVRMVPGRFLTAEQKGGPATISQSHESMKLYFKDYKRTSMAIPFESLVTDRTREKDTANWVTRLYYPVY
jgi:hypothetical protein